MIILSIIIDIMLIITAEYAGFLTRFGYPMPADEIIHFQNLWFIIVVIRIWALYSYNVYSLKIKSFITLTTNILKANLLSSIIIVAFTFFNRNFSYPRGVFLLSFIYTSAVLLIKYYIYWRHYIIRTGRKNILIIGATEAGKNIIKNSAGFKNYNWNFIGFIDEKLTIGKKIINNLKVLGKLKNLKKIISMYDINLIIIALPNSNTETKLKVLSKVEDTGIDYFIIPNFYEIVTGKTNIDEIDEFPILSNINNTISLPNRILKRIFDVIFSMIFLIFSFPFLFLIGFIIKITSPGPVLYKQLRAGVNGKPFFIYKFRTMVKDADKIGPLLTDKTDSRITQIGKFLRRFSLDELPQFYNVLKGDMSVVGPRPEVIEIVKTYKSWQRKVLQIKPGITGLAQISGRQELDIPTKLKIDLYYIKNYSFLLDLEIIFRTVFKTVKGDGAY